MAAARPVLLAALLFATPALAQSGPRQILPNLPLPAETSRPDPAAGVMRQVGIVQLDAEGEPQGKKLLLPCPATGCQARLELAVEGRAEQFAVTVTFVARGAYVNLEPRTLGSSRMVEFGAGRAGPAFIATGGRELASRDVHYVISRDATLRSAERQAGRPEPNTLADGYVFTRKLESDVTLRLEVQSPPG